jgi:hypothetical protein
MRQAGRPYTGKSGSRTRRGHDVSCPYKGKRNKSAVRRFFGGKAVVADATNFGAGDGNLNVAVLGDLLLELLVETGFEFTDLAAAETGYMDVVAWAVRLVVVAVAAEMEKVEFVDETFFLEQVDGAVDGDEVDFRADFLGAIENLVDVEVLFGGVHDLKNDAALAGETDTALAQGILEMAGRFGGVDAFATRDAMGWSSGHEAILREV